jgi:Zn-dependent alcohol dehydrogenase
VLIGIPPAEATLSLPASQMVRTERRVLGSVYGSARPERDFPPLLDLYLRGRLALDRLISARLPLEDVERAFDALRGARGTRFVLDLDGASA